MKIEDIKIGDELLIVSNGLQNFVEVTEVTKQNIFFKDSKWRYNIKEGLQRKEGASWDNYCSASLYQNEREYLEEQENRRRRQFVETHLRFLSTEEINDLYRKMLKFK